MQDRKRKAPGAGRRKGAGKYRHPDFSNSNNSPQDTVQAFHAVLDNAGLSTKDAIIPDGRLHRFRVNGDKPGSKNGWYVLYGDDLSAGAFGCWRRGIAETWSAKPDRTMTATERAEFARRMDEARKARQNEAERRHRDAQHKALAIWKDMPPALDDHPYLIKKRVHSHGLRLYKGALVIPMRDSAGSLHSLQFIDGDGNKRFLSGGRKKGCYFAIGTPADTVCICEGYATGASIHEATGHAVAVAFDAGNLLSVAQALRSKFPDVKIILCADNDAQTPGNPGLSKAREAAAFIGALLAVPPCAGDFNDLMTGGAA